MRSSKSPNSLSTVILNSFDFRFIDSSNLRNGWELTNASCELLFDTFISHSLLPNRWNATLSYFFPNDEWVGEGFISSELHAWSSIMIILHFAETKMLSNTQRSCGKCFLGQVALTIEIACFWLIQSHQLRKWDPNYGKATLPSSWLDSSVLIQQVR